MNVKYFITGTGNDEDDITEFSMIFLDSERKHKNGKESIWDGFVYFITEYIKTKEANHNEPTN